MGCRNCKHVPGVHILCIREPKGQADQRRAPVASADAALEYPPPSESVKATTWGIVSIRAKQTTGAEGAGCRRNRFYLGRVSGCQDRLGLARRSICKKKGVGHLALLHPYPQSEPVSPDTEFNASQFGAPRPHGRRTRFLTLKGQRPCR